MMSTIRIPTLIGKLRDHEALTREEIEHFVQAVTKCTMQPSQIGAMLMAIRLNGLKPSETIHLTRAMMESGEVLQWPPDWCVADKHSTGGVGDKVSLILAPALAACGVKVPMISGRGLGFAHGTLDKLEAIPDFQVSCTTRRMRDILEQVGCCIVGQTETLVPADRILYAIRDVTGTVESIPLISSSIVSKKVAESLSALVLDVKCGRAAYMKTEEEARQLANSMVVSSCGVGVKTVACLTRMDNPVGRMVGHSLEVIDALETMKGKGPKDLIQLVCTLGSHLLVNLNKVTTVQEGYSKLEQVIGTGAALDIFNSMLKAQGVGPDMADRLCRTTDYFEVFRPAKHQSAIRATSSGYVSGIDGFKIATVINSLGAGRNKAGDQINHAVGVQLNATLGDIVNTGDLWMILHHDEDSLNEDVVKTLGTALTVQDNPLPETATNRIIDIITAKTVGDQNSIVNGQ